MRRIAFVLLAMMAFWCAAPRDAEAACVLCSCSIDATDVAFGNFQPLDNTALDGAGAVTVNCGPVGLLVSYDVKLTAGGSGAFATRRMTSGVNTLSYNLYTTAARNTVWGDGTAGTGYVSDAWLISLGHTSMAHTIYGRIPVATTTRPGSYTDTVIARIEW